MRKALAVTAIAASMTSTLGVITSLLLGSTRWNIITDLRGYRFTDSLGWRPFGAKDKISTAKCSGLIERSRMSLKFLTAKF